ncbi:MULTISPECIES: hypothetical protein [Virgibacillus]|nr:MULTISPECIES: hypothetical protein [Virgibacillus]MBS7427283.1 hypothetical protein [Virgibacillus sp. 19R1-5]MBU8603010.1 hypothetical protein [Virgibacillus pantothenticus]MBU8644878.1 hypothetical protein [Virgibacillus pantothenticus]MBU8649036.1 hypothetical protein [Virgibacillus pantothenticus]MBU8666913.1 hypothetical protein [Virgibacillus pantothenticus]
MTYRTEVKEVSLVAERWSWNIKGENNCSATYELDVFRRDKGNTMSRKAN